MATKEEALRLWKEIVGQLQPRSRLRRGLIGTGGGEVEVPNRPTWVWIRYQEEQNRLSMVRCFLGVLEENTPVVVGKWHPEDDFEQVLGVYWGPYSMSVTDYTSAFYRVPPHGETHHGTYGSDPAYIDYSNFVMGRVSPTDPESMIVDVWSFCYGNGSTLKDFDGDSIDLSGETPAAGYHLYVLVYFDIETEEISYEVGDAAALAANPNLPTIESNSAIPLGVVRLYNGQTEITIEDLWQRKLVFGSIGGEAFSDLRAAVVYDGDVVTNDGEIVWVT